MAAPLPNRQELLTLIAEASLHGQLGLFVGAGFSQGVLEFQHPIPAYGWKELLEVVCKELGLNFADHAKPGMSCPDIASSLCDGYGKIQLPQLSQQDAQLRVKEAVARHTTWYPTNEQRAHFGPILWNLRPNWIITTNYDLVIEALLVGKAISVGPDKALPSGHTLIPVYHLHGMKYDPQSIVITREDYVSLFRPNEYRQAKLATAIKESTTVFLGYGLGDINVLTAMDWCRNVYVGTTSVHNTEMVLVLFNSSPKVQPYRNDQNLLVVEMDNLATFMSELNNAWVQAQSVHTSRQTTLEQIAKTFDTGASTVVEQFVDDPAFRSNVLSALKKFDTELIASFMTFFVACLDKTWERAAPRGAFDAYDEQLTIILDLLTTFAFSEMPPALFELLAASLERLGGYIGNLSGQSWKASQTWTARKGSVPKDIVQELRQQAKQRRYIYTETLLHGI